MMFLSLKTIVCTHRKFHYFQNLLIWVIAYFLRALTCSLPSDPTEEHSVSLHECLQIRLFSRLWGFAAFHSFISSQMENFGLLGCRQTKQLKIWRHNLKHPTIYSSRANMPKDFPTTSGKVSEVYLSSVVQAFFKAQQLQQFGFSQGEFLPSGWCGMTDWDKDKMAGPVWDYSVWTGFHLLWYSVSISSNGKRQTQGRLTLLSSD